jgi:uncharacterized lipoprotein YddW (UPF0748 family)
MKHSIIGFAAAALLVALSPAMGQQTYDNGEGAAVYAETGAWTNTTSGGYNNTSYRYAGSATARTAAWTAKLPRHGRYKVEAIFRAGTNRATSARYNITSGADTYTATADQTQNNLAWVTLGTFQLGTNSKVTLDAQNSTPSGRVVIADAVRFTLVPDSPEVRPAIVTVYDGLDTTAKVQTLVDQIAALNYNTIMVHARFRGDATYFPNRTNSTFPNNEPRSSFAGNIDVLQEFLTRGRVAGLEVIAYVNVFLVTDGKANESRPNHVAIAHPEWRTYAYNGGSPVIQTVALEDEGLWLDPALPEVRDYTAKICADIITNYDVDGIVVDRIRYPQTSWRRAEKDFGYHPTAIAAFNGKYGKSGVPSPTDADWIKFREDQVTTGIEHIYYQVTKLKPNLKVYGFPIGRFDDAKSLNYINSPRLLTEGFIDGVFPMIYQDDNAGFQTNVDKFVAAYSGPRILGAAINGFRANTTPNDKTTYARTKGMKGISYYTHTSMNTFGYNSTLRNVFTSAAPVPAMPWKTGGTSTTEVKDNGAAGYVASGTWSSAASAGYNNTSYQFATVGVASFATWDLNPPSTGDWKVEVQYRAGTNRATSASYRIDTSNGDRTVTVNQQQNNLAWVTLGTFSFVKGAGTITLDASKSTGGSVVIADAIRITKQ